MGTGAHVLGAAAIPAEGMGCFTHAGSFMLMMIAPLADNNCFCINYLI